MLELALVNVKKFNDVSNILILYLAFNNLIKLNIVGQSVDFNSVKVKRKLQSMNIVDYENQLNKIEYFNDLDMLKKQRPNQRFVATVAQNTLVDEKYSYSFGDIIIIGGANGLSKSELSVSDVRMTIKINPKVSFLKSDITAIMIATKVLALL
jgi:hypothetical protein